MQVERIHLRTVDYYATFLDAKQGLFDISQFYKKLQKVVSLRRVKTKANVC